MYYLLIEACDISDTVIVHFCKPNKYYQVLIKENGSIKGIDIFDILLIRQAACICHDIHVNSS